MIAIKTMTEMPEDCYECPCLRLLYIERDYCSATGNCFVVDKKRPDWCPLVEVKGDMVDVSCQER